MTLREADLPDFQEPPVIETVLGVSYPPLLSWKIPHYGLFWDEIRSEYPNAEVHPPIKFQVERFGDDEKAAQPPSVELLQEPEIRCWFINREQTRLVQVQRDGFLHNWRKVAGRGAYPHYEQIRPTFERDWRAFSAFLQREQIGNPTVSQCEVTYVNHLERGGVWNDFSDIPKVFPWWSGSTDRFLPQPDAVSFNLRFQLPKSVGRLRVSMQPAFRHSDGKDIIELRLTARAKPATQDVNDFLQCFDLGREWIVKGFADLTSKEAHGFWKRIQ